jgi:ribosomal protein S18 acetylase RimI-like enzyme
MNDTIAQAKTPFSIREMAEAEAAQCEQILRDLPEWFGIEEAILQYRWEIETMETSVVEVSGTLAGFITLNIHNDYSAEIHVLAMKPAYHGLGIGRRLVAFGEEKLIARSVEYLQVKTVGPSLPNDFYARTRNFYFHLGFRPLEETNLWGDRNPCLIMVKHLQCRSNDDA